MTTPRPLDGGHRDAQLDFAYGEVTGGDSIAAAHWEEILKAPDRATAKQLWSRYFERPGMPMTQADKALISDDALRHSLAQPNSQTIYGNVYDLLALLPEADEKTAGGKSKGNSLRQCSRPWRADPGLAHIRCDGR